MATPQLQVEFVGGRGGGDKHQGEHQAVEVVEGVVGVVEGGGGEGVEGAETSSEAETTHLNTSFHYVDLDRYRYQSKLDKPESSTILPFI